MTLINLDKLIDKVDKCDIKKEKGVIYFKCPQNLSVKEIKLLSIILDKLLKVMKDD